MRNLLKKNQVIIYIAALMLMTIGYLNYNSNFTGKSLVTSMNMESKDDTRLADIGDAQLVSSDDVVDEEILGIQENDNDINRVDGGNSEADNKENSIETVSAKVDDYFTKSKIERDSMYSQMLETYEKVLNSSNSLETQKQSATLEITKINEIKNRIMICENLIKTKGFENSIIFVNGDSISIIIGTDEIKKEEIAQIQNIIAREMNVNIENIHITTK